MEDLLAAYPVPEEKEMLLYTYVRLAHGFSDYATRLKSVQARLQALSVLIYSNQLTDSIQVGGEGRQCCGDSGIRCRFDPRIRGSGMG